MLVTVHIQLNEAAHDRELSGDVCNYHNNPTFTVYRIYGPIYRVYRHAYTLSVKLQ